MECNKLFLLIIVFLVNITLVHALALVNMSQSRCWEMEGSASPGYPDGSNLCETPFNVDTDNTLYEATASGNNNYAELRTAHNFNAPNYCYLLGVEACVDFFTTNLGVCTGIQVSNNGGGSWSTAVGSCPLSDSGIVCYNVTTLRTWATNCSDFRNNQSEILIELSYRGNNQLSTDYVRYRLSYTTPPNLTTPLPFPVPVYNNNTLNCSVNVTDNEETSLFVNFTWYQNGVRNSSYDNRVTCLNNSICSSSIIISSSGLVIGHNWTCSAYVFDGYLNSEWKNSTMVTIENRPPSFKNLSVNNNQTINLLAAQNATVTCNGTITEYDGYLDIMHINATFYSDGTGKTESSPDNRSNHYSNSSCTFTNNPGAEQIYTCGFSVDYYALNGSWTCIVRAVDQNGSTAFSQAYTNISQLIAIDISPKIADYGNLKVSEISNEIEVNFTNYGNTKLDIELYAYANSPEDELALGCDTGNIPLSYERFNLTSGMLYTQMTSMQGQSAPIIITDFDFPFRVWSDQIAFMPAYLRLQVPIAVQGTCNGKIVFTAIPG